MTAGASIDGGGAYVPGSGPDPGPYGSPGHPQPYGGHGQPAQPAGAGPGSSYPTPAPYAPNLPYVPNAPYSSRAPQVSAAPNSPYPAMPPYASPGQRPFGGGYPAPLEAPGVGPVVAFTALFGLWGAISAWRRARRAEAAGLPGGRYWTAFGVTLVVSWVVWTIVGVALAVVVPSPTSPVSATWLQDSIVREGDFKDGSGAAATVRSALCTAGDVDADGAGAYRCLVDFGDGQRQSYEVTVDANGRWVTD